MRWDRIGYDKIRYDKKKPNGTPRKKVNYSLAKTYGWNSRYDLEEGFKVTYKDFLNKQQNLWKTY